MKTSICSLVSHSSAFDKKEVEARAVVRTDRRHLVLLFDHETSDQGVALMIPESVRGDDAVAAMMRAIYEKPPAQGTRKLAATFTGKFEWHPKAIPARVLVLSAVTDMAITNTKK